MKSTGFYGVHLANYLSSSDLLAPFSVRVYCLNPKEVKNYKKSFNDIGKNDGIDSFVITDFARVGRISIKPWRGSQYLALQRLTIHRMHITECITREKTYMLNNIYLKFSEYALLRNGEHPFSNKYGATAEAVLTEYTTNEDIANSSIEELVNSLFPKARNVLLIRKKQQKQYRLQPVIHTDLINVFMNHLRFQ